ncbi:hypothetical protein F5887DRAFT_924642 [Amanita rubescens]|nr:hypothetical protein F5887DRAFT_924642 [Amanita rubescens]
MANIAQKNPKKKKCRGGKNLRYYLQPAKDLPEGVSKNSVKTGTKQGRKSKEAQKAKRKRDAPKIRAARAAAEAKWETYLVVAAPGELAKMWKYDMDTSGYITQTGTLHVPCPSVFFDANTEKGYIADIQKEKIFAGIQPLFLFHKFVNVLSKNGAKVLKTRWEAFIKTNPTAHNTKESSSARSTTSKSYHLGIWRRYDTEAGVTVDTRCENLNQAIKCLDFMRAVKKYIAPPVKRLMEHYTKEEWVHRDRRFGHKRHRNDAGLTWVFPMGEFEGGELCTPNYATKVPLQEGEAAAFNASFLGHMSAPLTSGIRLALTCFTDKNIMVDSQNDWKESQKRSVASVPCIVSHE